MTIALSTIGSKNVEVDVGPSALTGPDEAPGGVALTFRHRVETPLERITTYSLTADQARELVAEIGKALGDKR
jgi:hypothetical protein